jgi:hypothetical protein
MWVVVWSGDRSRRVIFAEGFWATVGAASDLMTEAAEFERAFEAMGESILRLFAEHWDALLEVTPSTRAHPVAHLDDGALVALVLVGRLLPPPTRGGPDSVVVESVTVVDSGK